MIQQREKPAAETDDPDDPETLTPEELGRMKEYVKRWIRLLIQLLNN